LIANFGCGAALQGNLWYIVGVRRSRMAFIVKLAGVALIFVGAATFPTSIGSPKWGLSIFQYIEALRIFLPVGIGLVVLGLVLLAMGYAISRDWFF